MLHQMIIMELLECEKILSGVKCRQVFLKNLSKENIKLSDKLMFCFQGPDDPIGVAEILSVQEMQFQEVPEAYWLQAGFGSIPEALGFYMNLNASLQLTDMVVVLSWGGVDEAKPSSPSIPAVKPHKDCEECCERDQT